MTEPRMDTSRPLTFKCGSCEEEHRLDDFQVGFKFPDSFLNGTEDQKALWAFDSDKNPSKANFDDKRFFLRGLIEIEVPSRKEPFGFGLWAEVDRETYFANTNAETPAASGILDTFIPGYPIVRGLEVTIRFKEPGLRPAYEVLVEDHPLAIESRNGVDEVRFLDLAQAFLHKNVHGWPTKSFSIEVFSSPCFARLDLDGWCLRDVVMLFRARDVVMWEIPEGRRKAPALFELVKLLFEIKVIEKGKEALRRERMWVQVDHKDGETFAGVLVNQPYSEGLLQEGDRVWFRPDHVLDIVRPDGTQETSLLNLINCHAHGLSQPALVCSHIVRGAFSSFWSEDGSLDVRPNAWCDECEQERRRVGEPLEDFEVGFEFHPYCAACYDEFSETPCSCHDEG